MAEAGAVRAGPRRSRGPVNPAEERKLAALEEKLIGVVVAIRRLRGIGKSPPRGATMKEQILTVLEHARPHGLKLAEIWDALPDANRNGVEQCMHRFARSGVVDVDRSKKKNVYRLAAWLAPKDRA